MEFDWVGKVLGKYRILRQLGQGGMGIVYAGRDEWLDREVAVKVLPQKVADDSVELERFLREARAAARFSHPNVVTVHEVGEHEGTYFLAMELMAGSTLDLLRTHGKLRWENATRAVAAVCRALAAAHAVGLVHRDIKPSNILRSSSGDVKLSDFGLVKSTGQEASLTTTNSVLGTPTYMSPEQCRSEPLDARSDLYSLGCTYYELLTGRPPFVAEQSIQVCLAHLLNPIPDASVDSPGVPPACAAIAARAMAKEPRDRYSDANEMQADLRRVLADPTTIHQRPGETPTAATLPASTRPEAVLPTTVSPADPPPVAIEPIPDEPNVVEPSTVSVASPATPTPPLPSAAPPDFSIGPRRAAPLGASAVTAPSPTVHVPQRTRPGSSPLERLTRREWFRPALAVGGTFAFLGCAYAGWSFLRKDDSPSSSGDPKSVGVPQSIVGVGSSQTTVPPTATDIQLADPWQPLFNGRNLDGWHIRPDRGGWTVEKGNLVGRGGTSYLFHNQRDWRDFELRAEFRINERGNSGIFFRCELNDSLPPGYEAHFDVWNPGRLHRTGLSGTQGIDPKTHVTLAADGWNEYNVRIVGNHITLQVNHVTTLDYVDNENGPTAGSIALQCYEPNTVVEFRKIEVRRAK